MVKDIGLIQPAQNVQESKLTATSDKYDGLRIGGVETKREDNIVSVWIKPKYKPENNDGIETSRHGHIEEDAIKAFEILDIDEETAVLLEEFIPVAVNEIGSSANFYKEATKTIALIDRVKNIQIPNVSEIGPEFENYVTLKNREKKYNSESNKLDHLTDLAVHQLYGTPTEGLEDGYPL